MDAIARSDIFFMITTVAVAVVALLFVAVLLYILKIVRDARAITRTFKDEAEKIAQDVSSLRHAVAEEVKKVRDVASEVTEKVAQAAAQRFTSNKSHHGEKEEKSL